MTEEIAVKGLEKTYREKRQSLLKYIQSRVSTMEEAEDILQDVFYQAIRHYNAIEPINNIMGWLFRIIKNKIIDWYRKKKHRTISLEEKVDEHTSLADFISDPVIHQPEDNLLRSLVHEAIHKSINSLPEKQREVFIKRELKGMSYKEIAKETGIPVNTLIAQKRYANLFLQKRLSAVKKIVEEI
jgi:RNA polymerase sigma factor (sigma-70 family)